MNKIIKSTIFTALIACFFSCNKHLKKNARNILARNYCTEIGRFDLLFYEDEISGSYLLLPKKSLGAVWGKLEGLKMRGRWIDEDGKGDIVIIFDQNFEAFSTSYRNDEHLEKWYTGSWNGHIRKNSNAEFSIDKKKFRCD